MSVDRAGGEDPVLEALDELLVVARQNMAGWLAVMERVEQVRGLRLSGLRYADMPTGDVGNSVMNVVATNQERLTLAGAHLRRASARQLLDEGMSIADIARAWGVSRQRVSNLLQERSDSPMHNAS